MVYRTEGYRIITVNVPCAQVTRFEQLEEAGLYTNRSEAVRDAIRDAFLLDDVSLAEAFAEPTHHDYRGMRLVTLNLPTPFVDAIAVAVANGTGTSRSDFIRTCIDQFFKTEEKLVKRLAREPIEPIEPPEFLPRRPPRIDMRVIRAGWKP